MHNFLSTCNEFGIDNSNRHELVVAAINALTYDTVLFLICGFDYINRPTSNKWNGIKDLFLNTEGEYALNLYPDCRTNMQAISGPGNLAQKMQHKGPGKAGVIGFDGSSAGIGKRAGVADYNLSTQVLEVVVTNPHGLRYQDTLKEARTKTQRDLSVGSSFKSRVGEATFAQMSSNLKPYWLDDLNQLGLQSGLSATKLKKSWWKVF